MIRKETLIQHGCDESSLSALLHDGEHATNHEMILEHLEQCSRCQQRFDTLAAASQDWTRARESLVGDDLTPEGEGDSGLWQFPIDIERSPVAWTDSMAKTLLSAPSHPEMLGRIGRYDVERLIGSGGMGVVFKAHDTELNRPVAVKLLAPYLAENGSARKRFAREARAAAAVVDEHVVAIHNVESGDDPEQPPFLVMKYIAGGSLQERLDRDGPLDVCEILRIGMQTAKGLAAAHAQGLIHRDVKPSNILLDEGVERALLTDFGLARAEDDACLTRSGFHPGTPHYMSPEQVRGEAIDGRSDLFGLGCVLYALCTGHPPFRAETSYAVLRRITDDTARPIRELNSEIPEWLERVVMKLLSKSREDRFESAEKVGELLEGCLAHVQHPATAPLPMCAIVSLPARNRRPPWGKLIAAAAFAFSLLLAGFLIVLELNKGTLTIESDIDGVPIRIMKGDQVVERLTVNQSGDSVRIAAGNYAVVIDGPSDAITLGNGRILLHRGENEIVKIIHATDTPKVSVASRDPEVLFTLSKPMFEEGDWIQIQTVTSSGNGLEVGSRVNVSGIYTLQSAKAVDLCFCSTTTLKQGETPTPTSVHPSQRVNAKQGTHAFQLSRVITQKGIQHITFYRREAKEKFGSVCFSVPEEEDPGVAAKTAAEHYLSLLSSGEIDAAKARMTTPTTLSLDSLMGIHKQVSKRQARYQATEFFQNKNQATGVFLLAGTPKRFAEFGESYRVVLMLDLVDDKWLVREMFAADLVNIREWLVMEYGKEHVPAPLASVPPRIATETKVFSFADSVHMQSLRLSNVNGKKAVDHIREISSILGISTPQFIVVPDKPRNVLIELRGAHAPEADWLTLYDLLQSENFDADPWKTRSIKRSRAGLLRHLKKQVERATTRLRFDELARIEQRRLFEDGVQEMGGELPEAKVKDIRQRVASELKELQLDARKAVLDLGLDGKTATDKKSLDTTSFALKVVRPQDAQNMILEIAKLFGSSLELPSSHSSENLLIVEKNGREEYFNCLSALVDGVVPDTDLSADQRMDRWKLRIRFLAMLERMMEAGSDVSSIGASSRDDSAESHGLRARSMETNARWAHNPPTAYYAAPQVVIRTENAARVFQLAGDETATKSGNN